MDPVLDLRWENSITARYYRCILHYDLLQDLVLITAYGSLHSYRGQTKKKYFRTLEAAMVAVEKIGKRRQAHGYTLTTSVNTFTVKQNADLEIQ